MTTAAGRGWRVILLTVGAGGVAIMMLISAALAVAYSTRMAPDGWNAAPVSGFLGSLTALFDLSLIALLLLGAAYHALRIAVGRPNPSTTWSPISKSQAATLIVAWVAASILAPLAVARPPWVWLTPILHALAIAIPVYVLSRISLSGLPAESRLRSWGALATGLFVAPSVAVIAEIGLLGLAGVGALVYLFQHPELVPRLEQLSEQLAQSSTMEQALRIMQPVLTQPAVLFSVLLAVAVVIPVIEELAKSIAPLLAFNLLGRPSSGFWCGALSGAGFALFEGLLASADASPNWTATLLIRGWSSLMHVMAAGVAGWGIAAFKCGRGPSRLLAGYGVALGLHAAWNASVVLIGYGGLSVDWNSYRAGPGSVLTLLLGGLAFALLIVGMPLVLALINKSLRAPRIAEMAPNRTPEQFDPSAISEETL